MEKINQSVAAGQWASHSTTLHGWGAGVLACVCINALIVFPSTVSALGFAISGRHTYTHRCKLASPAAFVQRSGLHEVVQALFCSAVASSRRPAPQVAMAASW